MNFVYLQQSSLFRNVATSSMHEKQGIKDGNNASKSLGVKEAGTGVLIENAQPIGLVTMASGDVSRKYPFFSIMV